MELDSKKPWEAVFMSLNPNAINDMEEVIEETRQEKIERLTEELSLSDNAIEMLQNRIDEIKKELGEL